MDDATYDGLMSNSIPYHEYIAVNKLVTWVQQVSIRLIFNCTGTV
jgi:hypothetical protein